MAKMDIEKKKCKTPMFRVSYPSLFEAQAFDEDQQPKYSVTMLFSKDDDISALKKIGHAACVEKWGKEKSEWPKKMYNPYRDGDEEKQDVAGYKNTIFVKASSKTRPGMIDAKKNDVEVAECEEVFYAGCYAKATVIASAWEKKGKAGLSFSLLSLMKMKDGEKFSGRKSAQEDFADEDEGEDDESFSSSRDDSDDEDVDTASAGF